MPYKIGEQNDYDHHLNKRIDHKQKDSPKNMIKAIFGPFDCCGDCSGFAIKMEAQGKFNK